MVLEFDEKEIEVLKMVLASYEAELRGEIGRTDLKRWRDALHGEEEIVKKLLNKVELIKKAA